MPKRARICLGKEKNTKLLPEEDVSEMLLPVGCRWVRGVGCCILVAECVDNVAVMWSKTVKQRTGELQQRKRVMFELQQHLQFSHIGHSHEPHLL